MQAALSDDPFTYSDFQFALKQFEDFNRATLARDRDGDMVFMAKSPWDVGYQQERNPDLTFSATKER